MVDIKKLAQIFKNTQLYDFLNEVKMNIADVRKPINVRQEIEVEVRKAVCEVIDDMIIQRLKTTEENKNENEDNWE